MTLGIHAREPSSKNKAHRSNTSFPRTREPRKKQTKPLPRKKRTGVAKGKARGKRLFLWHWFPRPRE